MPDYYLISNVYEEERTISPTHYNRNQPKPKPINLLLPSVHASRDHNILIADVKDIGDPQEAVSALLASCKESVAWPSSGYRQNEAKETPDNIFCYSCEQSMKHDDYNCTKIKDTNAHLRRQNNLPNAAAASQHYRHGRLWNYDSADPSVLDAARSLFFERKRQMALYGMHMHTPTWPHQIHPYRNPHHHPHHYPRPSRMPSEYELFTAWACLSRTEKQRYIHEVTNVSAGGTSLEARRAVSVLFASCPDSWFWPSLQFLRAEEAFAHCQFSYLPKR